MKIGDDPKTEDDDVNVRERHAAGKTRDCVGNALLQ
jgi:hypothetical protein